MTIKGEIKLQVRVPRYTDCQWFPPVKYRNLYRHIITVHMVHLDCQKPRSKCKCQMVRMGWSR